MEKDALIITGKKSNEQRNRSEVMGKWMEQSRAQLVEGKSVGGSKNNGLVHIKLRDLKKELQRYSKPRIHCKILKWILISTLYPIQLSFSYFIKKNVQNVWSVDVQRWWKCVLYALQLRYHQMLTLQNESKCHTFQKKNIMINN